MVFEYRLFNHGFDHDLSINQPADCRKAQARGAIPHRDNMELNMKCKTCKSKVLWNNVLAMWVENELKYICNKISSSGTGSNEDDNKIASAECYNEGIGGELVVTDDFGCVLYEEDTER